MDLEISTRSRSATRTSMVGDGYVMYDPTHDNDDIDNNPNDNDDANYKDDEDIDDGHESHRHGFGGKEEKLESFDFTDQESLVWRKHQYRRYFQGNDCSSCCISSSSSSSDSSCGSCGSDGSCGSCGSSSVDSVVIVVDVVVVVVCR